MSVSPIPEVQARRMEQRLTSRVRTLNELLVVASNLNLHTDEAVSAAVGAAIRAAQTAVKEAEL